jgi:hypothetical protein
MKITEGAGPKSSGSIGTGVTTTTVTMTVIMTVGNGHAPEARPTGSIKIPY